MLAARFSQLGAGRFVSCSQRYEVKWLQFLVRRLYEVPWNCSDASCSMALSSSSGRNENPCTTATLKVPPGGSWPGLRESAMIECSALNLEHTSSNIRRSFRVGHVHHTHTPCR
jgi:hypothetical protein